MCGPLGDAETTGLLIPNRYALLTDLADHATGFVLTLAYGGREIVLLHRRDSEGVASRLGGWRIVLGMNLCHIVSIFRYMEDAGLLKPLGDARQYQECREGGKGDGHYRRAVP
jgi:hypothetical protein